jgi:hypothetical protein
MRPAVPPAVRPARRRVSIHPRAAVALARVAALTIAALVLATPATTAAHPMDLGYLRIEADHAKISLTLDLELGTAAQITALPPEALDAATVRNRAVALATATFARQPIVTELGLCRWSHETATLIGRTVSLRASATCPTGARGLRWDLPFVAQAQVSSTFRLLVKARIAGIEHVTTIDRQRPELALGLTNTLGFREFVTSGVEHIGVTPAQWHDDNGWKLPDGIDHILFLLGLMLAGGSFWQLLGIASGFTVGHSITLALSALGVLRPPAALIEPLIALSIALVAAEAFLRTASRDSGRRRWKIAAAFGLVHGFGFASALHQLDLSWRDMITALSGYNLGVELGQVAIVMIIAPLMLMLQRSRRVHHLTVRVLASTIFVAGLYWFGQRLLHR